MAQRATITTEVEVSIDLSDVDTDTLASALEERGCIVLDEDEVMPTAPDLSVAIERRHAEQHHGTIRTCTDEICDAYDRTAGES